MPVLRDLYRPTVYDLENSPIQIRTNSLDRSFETVSLSFLTSEGQSVGQFSVLFTSSPQYMLLYCTSSYSNFPVTLPSNIDKIWTVTLSKTSGIRVMVHCNDVEVLNLVLSDSTCSSSYWSKQWNREVKAINFPILDNASDYYRPGRALSIFNYRMLT